MSASPIPKHDRPSPPQGETVTVGPTHASRWNKHIAIMRGHGAASLALIGLYPVLPGGWREADLLLVSAAAMACVGYGRRVVRRDRRWPWTLPLSAPTPARLVFLAIAVAVVPVVNGTREQITGDSSGLVQVVQGVVVAVLVMARIGLLSAQRTRAEQALEHQATHDPLTHLPNRRQFIAHLRDELARGSPCVVLFCDLDGSRRSMIGSVMTPATSC